MFLKKIIILSLFEVTGGYLFLDDLRGQKRDGLVLLVEVRLYFTGVGGGGVD